MLENKTVILGVTGSIAAYKTATLASLLVKSGADVHVLMTKNALNFINPITFETLTGNRCIAETFDRNFEFHVAHVSLAKKADIFVAAPASANSIAKFARGIADDMVSTTFLAASCPKLIAPAMNTAMYENPVTQENLQICRRFGWKILEPYSGRLACGDSGKGKMIEAETIFRHILHEIQHEKDLREKKILVTAGPTQESVDPVRFITNHSSGKMGFALAEEAAKRGAQVTLISGPVSLENPLFVETIKVTTAHEMFSRVTEIFGGFDAVIKAAAVADYAPVSASDQKIKKSAENFSLELKKTDDILKFIGKNKKPHQFICGFSMETQSLLENSRKKLAEKNLDMIVANDLTTPGAGFSADTNAITIITADSEISLPLMSKSDAANKILDGIKNGIEKNQNH
jgi:phosphopantothenoylcysteine decarboxylase/phosphopantothenate--cysteine ligase